MYVNPPYGRTIGDWVKKAYDERNNADIIVMLLPARTDTQWFHKWIYGVAEITFFKGRMKFNDGKDSAPFPSMIVVFKPDYKEDTAPTLF